MLAVVSAEDKKIAWKNFDEKLLKTDFALYKKVFKNQLDIVSCVLQGHG